MERPRGSEAFAAMADMLGDLIRIRQPMTLQSIESTQTPAPRDSWTAIYARTPGALPSQSPQWADAVVDAGGHWDRSRLYRFTDGTQAVLPLFATKAFLLPGAWTASPPPAWGFGGLLMGETPTVSKIHAVLGDLERLPALRTQIRPDPLQAHAWAQAMPEGWTPVARHAHVLRLAPRFEEVWDKSFKSDARNKIRRAEKAGLEVVSGNDPQMVSEFYRLLQLSFLRWGRKQHEPAFLARLRGRLRDPEEKLQSMARSIGPTFRLWLARLDGRAIAGIVVLRDREAHYTRGAMDEEPAGRTFANYLLHARAIAEACAAGCTVYNMGESGTSSSLAQFKSRFGAEPIAYSEYRRERLPIASVDRVLRLGVKRLIGFRDA
jgi:hypothetical protein